MPDGAWLAAQLTALHEGRHFALAVSGGPDSMALLALAAEARDVAPQVKFSVLTVNHGLRPAAADEAAMVHQTCLELGLPHVTLHADMPLAEAALQETARHMRYALLADWCQRHGADALVLAHHASDQAETLLMRMARQSGLDGLAGMAARQTVATDAGSLVLLRPLLNVQKQDLASLLAQAGLPSCDDPSNYDRRFERVRWRQALTAKASHGEEVARLGRLAARLRQRRNRHDAQDMDWLQSLADWHRHGVLRLPRPAFQALPQHRQMRLLRGLLGWIGRRPYPPKRDKCNRALAAMQEKPAGAVTLAGCLMRWRGEAVFLGREMAALAGSRHGVDSTSILWDGRFRLDVAPDRIIQGLFVAPLGAGGLAQLAPPDIAVRDSVNAAYLHVLPAFFDNTGLLACPLLQPQNGFNVELAAGLADFTGMFPDRSGW